MRNQGSWLRRLLDGLERIGNRLPDPALLFIYLCLLVLLLSALLAATGLSAVHPVSGERIAATNLISIEGLHLVLRHTVSNFTQFAPVGTVLVAMLGMGIAEQSGLIGTVLRATVLRAPTRMLTFLVVLAGVLSSLAADTGYVVLVPLAAIIFQSVGRHPIAGIAAAFAGVSGGYSANLLVGPLDAILAGLSTAAAGLVDPDYEVNAAANYYFIVISTLLIAAVGTWVTEALVAPRLGSHEDESPAAKPISDRERRGLSAVGIMTAVVIGLLLWGLLPTDGILRDPDTGSILRSPFIAGIVTVIAAYAGVAGWLFGVLSGNFTRASDTIRAMESSMATMAGYLVLMFFAAQFVNYFDWSHLGIIVAIKGSAVLQSMNLNSALLLVYLVCFCAVINLLVGSASAKWALLAPIFVPMLMLVGISPEATQMAYRIGDSSTNIITPLMPYFGVVVAFARKYDRDLGIGTLVATMLPYSVCFLVSWSALLAAWVLLDLPLGPGAAISAN